VVPTVSLTQIAEYFPGGSLEILLRTYLLMVGRHETPPVTYMNEGIH
jgi:hypothetical protein